jgi:putative transposase
MSEPHRKPNRLPEPSYHGCRIYFLTLCTHGRRKVLTNRQLVQEMIDVLRECCTGHSYAVYAFCFMPDHLHLVVAGMNVSATLRLFVRALKGVSAFRARALGITNLWQKGFYDHVVRDGEGADRAAWYVFMNPVRARLVKDLGEWSYSGSFMFDWRKLAAPAEAFVPPWKKSATEAKRAG